MRSLIHRKVCAAKVVIEVNHTDLQWELMDKLLFSTGRTYVRHGHTGGVVCLIQCKTMTLILYYIILLGCLCKTKAEGQRGINWRFGTRLLCLFSTQMIRFYHVFQVWKEERGQFMLGDFQLLFPPEVFVVLICSLLMCFARISRQNHRMVEVGRDLLEVFWSKSPAQQMGSPRAGFPGPCPDSFWISPRMKMLRPFWSWSSPVPGCSIYGAFTNNSK